jgi:hypothetical protein
LYCPGIGIAVDSCAALIALFDRAGAGSASVAVAGDDTDAATGTDGSATDPAVAPDAGKPPRRR